MPDFNRNGWLEDNYVALLFALGLLSEETPGVTKEMAERELAHQMPAFCLQETSLFDVGPNKYKTAAFFFAKAKEKGQTTYTLDESDIDQLHDYLTWAVLIDEQTNPSKHAALAIVNKFGVGTNVSVQATI